MSVEHLLDVIDQLSKTHTISIRKGVRRNSLAPFIQIEIDLVEDKVPND